MTSTYPPNRDPGPVMTDREYRAFIAQPANTAYANLRARMPAPELHTKTLNELTRAVRALGMPAPRNRYEATERLHGASRNLAMYAAGMLSLNGAAIGKLLAATVYTYSYWLRDPDRIQAFARYRGYPVHDDWMDTMRDFTWAAVRPRVTAHPRPTYSDMFASIAAEAEEAVRDFDRHMRKKRPAPHGRNSNAKKK